MPKQDAFQEPKAQSLFENEEEVLQFWKKERIFEKSLKRNPASKTFSFYDGPPFITGLPHYATLLPSIAKDIIPRYKTMKGYYVPRVWGWDVHGLPAENKVERQLGLQAKEDIERYGIKNFVEAARKYVNVSTEEWRWYIEHIGRWADMDHAYRTDDVRYMESVLWVFKELYKKGLIYKGKRVFLYCTRCATVVSKFETTMDSENYKNVEDPAVTVAFKLKDEKDTAILAWTTTPYTLPANNGIAVHPNITYAAISNGKTTYILAKDALARYPEFKNWRIKNTFPGKKLAGKSYTPLFQPNIVPDPQKDYHIHLADFPTTDEGTGVVHIAPAFGEDDFNLGLREGLTIPITLDDNGKFLTSVPWRWKGVYFKDANEDIIAELRKSGSLVRSETIIHSYPHCYRCATPLIYMAQDSWLMKIDPLRKQLLETNKKINWVPAHFGKKRFAYNIANAPDWSISRTRYWGIPLPIWETKSGERLVVGSIKEIEQLSGRKVKDLHRPYIDEIVLTTPSGEKAYRVPEVLDVWFESGSMPYGQDHYPFENKAKFARGFPADFIIEYTGQLRGWFYYLHVLANALFKKPAFKNVAVTGVLMGTDGRKMSKSYGNYPDPKATIVKYGAESLRLYFMGSKIMSGEDLNLSEEDIREEYRLLNILWNSYKYFVTYANLHKWKPSTTMQTPSSKAHVLDQWITVRLEEFINDYSTALDKFDFQTSTRAIRPFVEDLSTWYIRRSRERFVKGDKRALQTLYSTLLTFAKAVAPTLPFTAEAIYRNLTHGKAKQSVHLEDYPKAHKALISKHRPLTKKMALAREIASAAHNLRAESGQPVRQKLSVLVIKNIPGLKSAKEVIEVLKEEVNVLEVKFDAPTGRGFIKMKAGGGEVALDTRITEELKEEGLYRELIRALQDARKAAGLKVGEKAALIYSTPDKNLEKLIEFHKEDIMKAAHFKEVKKGKGTTEILNKKAKVKIESRHKV